MENENKNPFLTQIHPSEENVNNSGVENLNDNHGEKPKKKVSIWAILFWIFLLLLFLSVLLIFVLIIWWPNSPLLTILWIEALTIQQSLLSLTSTIFSVFSIVLFLMLSVWIFRWLLAKKEEVDKKRFSLFLSLFSWLALFITMIVWIWLYNFIAKFEFQLNIKAELTISPTNTKDLIAPALVGFSINKAIIVAEAKWQEVINILWDFNNDWITDKKWLDYSVDYEVRNSWINKVTVKLEFKNWSSQSFENIFSLGQATFYAKPDNWPAPLEVEFNASNLSDSGGNDIKEYRWFFNWIDSEPVISKEPIITQSFNKIWIYPVILQTLDTANVVKRHDKDITVRSWELIKDVEAIIKVYPWTQWEAPFRLTLDWNESSSTKWDIVSYRWQFLDTWEYVAWRSVNYVYEKAWEYELRLLVKDTAWNQWTETVLIKVSEWSFNPVASISTKPSDLNWSIPFTVEFDASDSTDANNDIIEYSWDYNWDWVYDAFWEKVEFVFRDVWKQLVILKVTDSTWNDDIAKLSFDLSDITGNAVIWVDKISWSVPLIISFDWSASEVESEDVIVNYEWDFWDWTKKEFSWAKKKHRFINPGNYTVSLSVYTEKWEVYTTTKQVFAREQWIQACFEASKTKARAASKIKFDSQCSIWDIDTWTWDFWDWNISRSRSPIHEFAAAWKYTVILRIADTNNNISDYEQLIEIE